MPLPCPSSQKTAALALALAASAAAQAPGAGLAAPAAASAPVKAAFTVEDAIRCEWERRPPRLAPEALAALSPADRARLELSIKRIGAPGAPALLPPELETPTREAWEAKALAARTPEERFTALHFLNRLGSPKAIQALEGLNASDAATWPVQYHLELPFAMAVLQGGVPSEHLQAFIKELKTAGKVDPQRAEAARILTAFRTGKGAPRLTDPNRLIFLDAWNRGPWEVRAKEHLALLAGTLATQGVPGPTQRLVQGLPPQPLPEAVPLLLKAMHSQYILVRMAALEHLAKLPSLAPELLEALKADAFRNYAGPLCPAFAAALRKHAPSEADRYDRFLLGIDDTLALAAALEDMPKAPAHLDTIVQRLWKTSQYDAVQVFLPALERWQLPEDQRKAILARFLEHPCWTARLDAYHLLARLDPATPWPASPKPSFVEQAVLEEALRLAKEARPVRLRITFSNYKKVVLKLDPTVAPINVANLELLARRGFFDGQAVPRVVPDFVVQMGSPTDTMDGGPGYTVRCEDSLEWYGTGSVGMALSGKDTGGSQFFITTNPAPHLTGRYTRVGEVEDMASALPILDALEVGTKILKIDVF